MLQRMGAAYFGGALAALIASVVLVILARAELLEAIGVDWRPELSGRWISGRMLWGSFWALGLPTVRRFGLSPLRSAAALSLLPTLVELFYFLPEAGHETAGLEHGTLMPVVILVANLFWAFLLSRYMQKYA